MIAYAVYRRRRILLETRALCLTDARQAGGRERERKRPPPPGLWGNVVVILVVVVVVEEDGGGRLDIEPIGVRPWD